MRSMGNMRWKKQLLKPAVLVVTVCLLVVVNRCEFSLIFGVYPLIVVKDEFSLIIRSFFRVKHLQLKQLLKLAVLVVTVCLLEAVNRYEFSLIFGVYPLTVVKGEFSPCPTVLPTKSNSDVVFCLQ